MKAKLAIPPPEDWIQFEIVCKKVWGLLWQIPNEIDFNSTNSQGQQGIDLMGIPRGEKQYFGIQCKNKRLHLKTGVKNKITTELIDEEIKKALDSIPTIQHLVIATSLYKDRKIEEYVRLKNIAHIAESKFTVQICFWEYISETIQENQHLYNWYLGQRDYIASHKAEIVLDNGSCQKYFYPEFIREKRIYRHQTEDEKKEQVEGYSAAMENLRQIGFDIPWRQRIKDFFISIFNSKKYPRDTDLVSCRILVDGKPLERTYPEPAERFAKFDMEPSYELEQGAYFSLVIKNIGANVIEDYKLSFYVDGEFEDFNKENPPLREALNKTYPRHSWKTDEKSGAIEPEDNFLIQNDQFESHRFYIVPKKNMPTKATIHWVLLARNYSEKGSLDLIIEPKYIEEESHWYIHPNDIPYEKLYYRNKTKKGIPTINF